MDELSDLLAENPVFGHLEPDEQSVMLACSHLHRYQDGAFIAHIGDVWPYLFMVAEGAVNVVKESVDGAVAASHTSAGRDVLGNCIFH